MLFPFGTNQCTSDDGDKAGLCGNDSRGPTGAIRGIQCSTLSAKPFIAYELVRCAVAVATRAVVSGRVRPHNQGP